MHLSTLFQLSATQYPIEHLWELVSRACPAFSWPCQQPTTPSERALMLHPCYMHNRKQRQSYMLMSKKLPEPPAQQKDLPRQGNMQLCIPALRSKQLTPWLRSKFAEWLGSSKLNVHSAVVCPVTQLLPATISPQCHAGIPATSSPTTNLGYLLGKLQAVTILLCFFFRAMTQNRFPITNSQ